MKGIRRIAIDFADGTRQVIQSKHPEQGLDSVTIDRYLDWSHLKPVRRLLPLPPRELMKERTEIKVEGSFDLVSAFVPPETIELADCYECGAPQGPLRLPR